jgi:hypothetical protein
LSKATMAEPHQTDQTARPAKRKSLRSAIWMEADGLMAARQILAKPPSLTFFDGAPSSTLQATLKWFSFAAKNGGVARRPL